jgi:rhodanese-related sulfurtransferase
MSFLNSIFSKNENINTVDSATFEKMMNENDVVVLDVRTPLENQQMRIPNSILMDVNDYNFDNKVNKLDRSKKYLVYCRSGHRSFYACKKLVEMGFGQVFNLKYGIGGYRGETIRS